MQCLNCQKEITGNFCSNCGQRTNTRQITMSSVMEHLLQGLSNINRGFLYNVKMLSLRPGPTMMEYLAGKRIRIFSPVQYAIIAVTILTIVDSQFGTKISGIETSETIKESNTYSFGYLYGKFLRENLRYMWLLTIIAFAWPASWFFRKLNFAEHLTVQAFICGHAALITVVSYLLISWIFIFNPMLYLSIWVLMFLAYRQQEGGWYAFSLSFFVLLIGLLLFILIPATFIWMASG